MSATAMAADPTKSVMAAKIATDAGNAGNPLFSGFATARTKVTFWGARVVDGLHLHGPIAVVRNTGGWFGRKLASAWGVVRNLGAGSLGLLAVTCRTGRKLIRGALNWLGKALHFVSWPLRMVGRGIGWLCDRWSPAARAKNWVVGQIRKVKAKAVEYYNRVDAWLERHDGHIVTRCVRAVAEGLVTARGIMRWVPLPWQPLVWIGACIAYGVRQYIVWRDGPAVIAEAEAIAAEAAEEGVLAVRYADAQGNITKTGVVEADRAVDGTLSFRDLMTEEVYESTEALEAAFAGKPVPVKTPAPDGAPKPGGNPQAAARAARNRGKRH